MGLVLEELVSHFHQTQGPTDAWDSCATTLHEQTIRVGPPREVVVLLRRWRRTSRNRWLTKKGPETNTQTWKSASSHFTCHVSLRSDDFWLSFLDSTGWKEAGVTKCHSAINIKTLCGLILEGNCSKTSPLDRLSILGHHFAQLNSIYFACFRTPPPLRGPSLGVFLIDYLRRVFLIETETPHLKRGPGQRRASGTPRRLQAISASALARWWVAPNTLSDASSTRAANLSAPADSPKRGHPQKSRSKSHGGQGPIPQTGHWTHTKQIEPLVSRS